MKFTICGSAKFESEFHQWNKKLGLDGHISYSLMTFPSVEGAKSWYTPEEKWILDLAHFAKIEESDAILVLNIGGYVGESTNREIIWAYMRGKKVFWVEGDHIWNGRSTSPTISTLASCFDEPSAHKHFGQSIRATGETQFSLAMLDSRRSAE